MSRYAVAGLALLLSTAPVLAAPVTLPCALPLDERFVLTIEQHGWTRSGAPSLVTLRRDIDFAPEGDGRLVTLGPARATSNLTGREKQRFDLAYGSGGAEEEALRLHVDAAGQVTAIDDLAVHWQRYLDLLGRLADLADAQGDSSERTRAVLAALKLSDMPTRMAAFDGPLVPLLRHCGAVVEPDAGSDADHIVVVERNAESIVREEVRYIVSRENGLVMALERVLTPDTAPEKPQREHWLLEPDNQ